MANILVATSNKVDQKSITGQLSWEGHKSMTASTAEAVLALSRSFHPELIILEQNFPDSKGFSLIQMLKEDSKTCNIKIILLLPRGDEGQMLTALELGVDSFLTIPYGLPLLMARVRAALRAPVNGGMDESAPIVLRDIVIDPVSHRITIMGKRVYFTLTQFSILKHLAMNPGKAISRKELLDVSRGEDYPAEDYTIAVHMCTMRKKLGPCAHYIETVKGVGYRMVV